MDLASQHGICEAFLQVVTDSLQKTRGMMMTGLCVCARACGRVFVCECVCARVYVCACGYLLMLVGGGACILCFIGKIMFWTDFKLGLLVIYIHLYITANSKKKGPKCH